MFTSPRVAIMVAIALSGCAPAVPDSPSLPQRIIPANGGLKIANSGGQEISFGRVQPGVVNAINKLVGAPPVNGGISAQGCDLRKWKNGLELVFDQGRFVGWIVGPPIWQTPSTAAGNTCGFDTHNAG